MLNATVHRSALFSLVVPALALLVSASFVLFPMLRAYGNLKHAPRTTLKIAGREEVYIQVGQLQFPADRLSSVVADVAASQQEPAITFLNAPGYLINALAGPATGHEPHWSPGSIFPPLWRVLMIPLCAIPAWWFVGRGIDGFFKRSRLRLADMIVGTLLLLGSATISAALWFGQTADERTADQLSAPFVAGFAWWTALFAIPVSAWAYQRYRASREQ